MKYNNIKITVLISLLFLSACGSNATKISTTESSKPGIDSLNVSFEDSLSQDLKTKLHEIELLYNEALKSIQKEDSASAESYFSNSMEIISNFSEDELDEIQDNPLYASILKTLEKDYHRIFNIEESGADRDLVMDEIGAAEDEIAMMPDSLSGKIGEVVDSTAKFPLVINPRVSAAMTYFQTRGRNVFERWLARSGRYRDLYSGMLRKENVPEEFVYLAMIESGFVNHAYSYARAAGPWQFMAGTGRMYGLRSSWWFDERRDPLKATEAAAKHLNSLYDYFDGNWVLAMAGYNVNPAKVRKRVRIQGTDDFWKLSHLPKQTLNYVPTFMAAAIMAKNPEKYGFNPEYKDPFVVDTVLVSEAVDLSLVAQWTDTTYAAIRDMNPAVLRWCTPPGVKNFSLNIPPGKKDKFVANLKQIPEKEKISYFRYRIKGGDALGTIAEKFHVSVSVIKKHNKINGNRIYAGKYLIIPVPKNRQAYYASKQPKTYRRKTRKHIPVSIAGRKKVVYIVRSGDTVGQIAEDFQIRASEIRSWNGISSRSVIYPGQKLAIFTPVPDALDRASNQGNIEKAEIDLSLKPGETYYTIRRGDTLWEIARKHKTTIEELKARNGISSAIRPGEKLIITH